MTKEEWVAKLEFAAKTSKDLTGDLMILLDEFIRSATFAYGHPSFIGSGPFGPEILAGIQDAKIRKMIRERAVYLRKQEYIRLQKKAGHVSFKMTKDGRVRILYQKIRYQERVLPGGELTIVAFDIPEDIKATRWILRKRLREFGFEQHQKSVWVTQKDIASDLAAYIGLIGARKWVSIFKGSRF